MTSALRSRLFLFLLAPLSLLLTGCGGPDLVDRISQPRWGLCGTLIVVLNIVALIDLLGEGNDETPEVVGDIAMLGFTQQAHGAVHHSQGEADERIQEAEALAAELFEERFGQSFAEMTGHDH